MTTKDSRDKTIKIQTLRRLDEQIPMLCRSRRYNEALHLSEKASQLAKSIFPPGHSVIAVYTKNVAAIRKIVLGNHSLARENAKPEQVAQPEQVVKPEQVAKPERKLHFNWKFILKVSAVTLILAVSLSGLIQIAVNKSSRISTSAYANSDQTVEDVPFYRVKASFSPKDRTVEGVEEVTFNNPLQRRDILFDLYFNRYRNRKLDSSEMRRYAVKGGVDHGYIDILWVTAGGKPVPFRQTGEILRLSLNGNQFPAGECSFKIGFRLKVPYILDRSGGDNDGIWLGNWLPTLSVRGLTKPTEIGDPFVNVSSDYETEFSVPKEYKLVLSNTYSIEDSGDARVYKSRLHLVRDLPVFLNRGYREAVVDNGDTEIHYYFRSTNSRPVEVLDIARKSLLYYENYVGEYPWKQLNIVENDMFLNGMEYSTLLLLSSKAVHKNMEETVFHEVGHQWFYNILGNDQYSAAFIDEGFVEFLTWYGLEKQEPRYYDGLPGLENNLGKFNSWRNYREVHYRNGRKLFESIYVLLGKNEFEKFIKEYYDKYKFTLVSSGEFKKFLSKRIGEQNTRKLLP